MWLTRVGTVRGGHILERECSCDRLDPPGKGGTLLGETRPSGKERSHTPGPGEGVFTYPLLQEIHYGIDIIAKIVIVLWTIVLNGF